MGREFIAIPYSAVLSPFYHPKKRPKKGSSSNKRTRRRNSKYANGRQSRNDFIRLSSLFKQCYVGITNKTKAEAFIFRFLKAAAAAC